MKIFGLLLFLSSFVYADNIKYIVKGYDLKTHEQTSVPLDLPTVNETGTFPSTTEGEPEPPPPGSPIPSSDFSIPTPWNTNKARVGPENRVQAPNRTFPYSAIARVTFCKNNNGTDCGYVCSSWRVSKGLIMLNGHCVYEKATKQWHSNFRVDLGYNNGTYVQREYPIYVWVSQYYLNGTTGVDWGALRLRTDAPNYTGWFGYQNYSSGWNNQNYWVNSGYGTNWTDHPFSAEFQGMHFGCPIHGLYASDRQLFHSCDMGQGSSGSPIFSWWNNGGWRTVGINYGEWGPRDANRMQECHPPVYGTCGNVGTHNSVYGQWITDRRNEGI